MFLWFKQKTAYEMRISDWSSDVCSSDLRRQDHDVDLGMAEEPEDVLEHHRVTAAGGVEEAGGEILVGQQHGYRTGQHWHHRDQQERGDQPGPHEQRHQIGRASCGKACVSTCRSRWSPYH